MRPVVRESKIAADMIRRRLRMNRSLRLLRVAWMPLTVVYATWLGMVGYECARWAGAFMVVLLGTAYPLVIALSLSAGSVEPMPVGEDKDKDDDERSEESRPCP